MHIIFNLIVDTLSLSVESYINCNKFSLSCLVCSFGWSLLMSHENQFKLILMQRGCQLSLYNRAYVKLHVFFGFF